MAQDSYEIWLKATRAKLAVAKQEAAPLVDAGQFDEAETLVRRVESDIYGAVALGELYTSALERYVKTPGADRARGQVLFERALRWRSASPEPHTADEAASARSHADAVRQELTALLEEIR